MPMPPLLLADRVVGLLGEPASMRTGTIWTETDVRADSWYLHEGRMPTGILIESGQADLMLISWLGVDLHNRGDRVYRLLGCELTFHGQLPADRRDAALRDLHRRARAARRRRPVLLPLRLQVRRRAAPERAPGPGRLLHRRGTRRERGRSCGIPRTMCRLPMRRSQGRVPASRRRRATADQQVAAFAEGDVMTRLRAGVPALRQPHSHARASPTAVSGCSIASTSST